MWQLLRNGGLLLLSNGVAAMEYVTGVVAIEQLLCDCDGPTVWLLYGGKLCLLHGASDACHARRSTFRA